MPAFAVEGRQKVLFMLKELMESEELYILWEQLPFWRSACPGLGLYHCEAAPGIPNHVLVAGTCRVPAAVGKVK